MHWRKWLFKASAAPMPPELSDYDKALALLKSLTPERFSNVYDSTTSIKFITTLSPQVGMFIRNIQAIEQMVNNQRAIATVGLESCFEQSIQIGDFFKEIKDGQSFYLDLSLWVPLFLRVIEQFLNLFEKVKHSESEADKFNLLMMKKIRKNVVDTLEGLNEYL